MSLRSLRSRLDRLVKSSPPVPLLNWNNFAATSPDAIRPDGSGIDWPAMFEPTPITDAVTDLVARLPPRPEPAGNPDHPDELVPAATEPVFPPGYRPEPFAPETERCS